MSSVIGRGSERSLIYAALLAVTAGGGVSAAGQLAAVSVLIWNILHY